MGRGNRIKNNPIDDACLFTNSYNDTTLDQAEEAYMFGFAVVCDGDSKSLKYETYCNRCGKTFQSDKITVYCDECKNTK